MTAMTAMIATTATTATLRLARHALAAALVPALSACASFSVTQAVLPPCPLGERATSVTLYFGATAADGARLPAARWDAFEASALQALFPDGFTVVGQAHGTWKDPATGRIERDPTWMVQAVMPRDVDVRALVHAAADRFRAANPAQKAIGAVVQDVCSDFDVRAAEAL